MADSSGANHPDFHDLLAFTPVPLLRKRANGWSAERQRRFVLALSVMGSVGPAVRAFALRMPASLS